MRPPHLCRRQIAAPKTRAICEVLCAKRRHMLNAPTQLPISVALGAVVHFFLPSTYFSFARCQNLIAVCRAQKCRRPCTHLVVRNMRKNALLRRTYSSGNIPVVCEFSSNIAGTLPVACALVPLPARRHDHMHACGARVRLANSVLAASCMLCATEECVCGAVAGNKLPVEQFSPAIVSDACARVRQFALESEEPVSTGYTRPVLTTHTCAQPLMAQIEASGVERTKKCISERTTGAIGTGVCATLPLAFIIHWRIGRLLDDID